VTLIAQPAKVMNDQPTPPSTDEASVGTIFTPHRRTQLLVIAASVLCFFLFWWGGKWIGVPTEPGYSASLLQQPTPALAFIGTYIMLACAVVFGTLVAGRAWFYAGLFTGCIGQMALSARGGPMRYVLFQAADGGGSQRVFLMLFLEQGLLFLAIGLLWRFFWRRYETMRAAAAAAADAPIAPADTATALLIQAAGMATVVLLAAATDAKTQVLVAVFLGGLAGTTLAEMYARKTGNHAVAGWFWLAPFVVGAFGYLVAYFTSTTWAIGDPGDGLARLARPLPLDYASAGCAGALLGYWVGADRPSLCASILSGLFSASGHVAEPVKGKPNSNDNNR